MEKTVYKTIKVSGGVSCGYRINDDYSVVICGNGKDESGHCASAIPKETPGRLVLPGFIGKRVVSGIASGAFVGCKNLSEVVIPAGVLVIGSSAFCGCESLYSVKFESELKDCRGFFDKLCGKKLGDIATGLRIIRDAAFSSCRSLQKLSLPSTLVKIDRAAFSGCAKLSVHKLPDSLCDLNCTAFDREVLRYAEFPPQLTVAVRLPVCGEYRIAHSGEEAVQLMESDQIEQHSLFDDDDGKSAQRLEFRDERGCLWRYRILFDDTIRLGLEVGEDHNWGVMDDIGISEPKENTSAVYQSIEVASAPQEIDGMPVVRLAMGAFMSCNQLKRLSLAEGMYAIPPCCFIDCEALEDVKLPNSVVKIGSDAFCRCNGLKRLRFPSELNYIGQKAFSPAFNVQDEVSLDMPESLVAIDDAAFRSAKCRHLTLNSGLRMLGREAFAMSSLDDVELGSGLTTIPYRAFKIMVKLERISVPENVKVIEDEAFARSGKLSEVEFQGRGTLVSKTAFQGCPCAASVYGRDDIVILPDTENDIR